MSECPDLIFEALATARNAREEYDKAIKDQDDTEAVVFATRPNVSPGDTERHEWAKIRAAEAGRRLWSSERWVIVATIESPTGASAMLEFIAGLIDEDHDLSEYPGLSVALRTATSLLLSSATKANGGAHA